jgi:DNA-binding response OmpR family regulator
VVATPAGVSGVEAKRALILDGRRPVVALIEQSLNHGLFAVRAASDLDAAEWILAGWRPHLTVIDMDHDDSAALLRLLGDTDRLTRRVTPTLALTRRGDLGTRLRAFELGVDDILTVPFSQEELRARAIVITRRATGADRPTVPTIDLGDTRIDILRREVHAGSSLTRLTAIEQRLLHLLATRAGRVVTRDEILDAIWAAGFVPESNLVDRHVRGLRAKLKDDYRHPRFIATVPGVGYRFIPTFSSGGWLDGKTEVTRARPTAEPCTGPGAALLRPPYMSPDLPPDT